MGSGGTDAEASIGMGMRCCSALDANLDANLSVALSVGSSLRVLPFKMLSWIRGLETKRTVRAVRNFDILDVSLLGKGESFLL